MSVLRKLQEARVVAFYKDDMGDGTNVYWVEECCDNYFHLTLNDEEFAQLVEELIALRDRKGD